MDLLCCQTVGTPRVETLLYMVPGMDICWIEFLSKNRNVKDHLPPCIGEFKQRFFYKGFLDVLPHTNYSLYTDHL